MESHSRAANLVAGPACFICRFPERGPDLSCEHESSAAQHDTIYHQPPSEPALQPDHLRGLRWDGCVPCPGTGRTEAIWAEPDVQHGIYVGEGFDRHAGLGWRRN